MWINTSCIEGVTIYIALSQFQLNETLCECFIDVMSSKFVYSFKIIQLYNSTVKYQAKIKRDSFYHLIHMAQRLF